MPASGIFEGVDPQEFVVLSTYSREKFSRFSEGITPPEEFYDDFFHYIREQRVRAEQRQAAGSVRKERVRRTLEGMLSVIDPEHPRRG
jgi:hypothetical protein